MNTSQNSSQQTFSVSFQKSPTELGAREYAKKGTGGILLAFSLIISFVFSRLVLHGGGFGYSMPILTALSWIFFLPLIISRDKKFSWTGLLSLIPVAVLSIECALFNNGTLIKFITLLTMLVLTMLQNAKLSGITAGRFFSWTNVKNGLAAVFSIPFEVMGAAYSSLKGKKKEKAEGKKSGGTIGKVLIGLLVSLPAVVFLLSYFALTDDVFGYYFVDIIKKLNINLAEIILDVIVACLITLYLFPQKFGLCAGTQRGGTETEKKNKGIDGVYVTSFLGSCFVVYLAFVMVQLSYLFNSDLPADMKSSINYSEYARSGFFSLCFIIFVTFVVILIAMKITKKKESGNMPVHTKIVLILLALSDIIFVASALMRLSIYVSAYGLTRTRITGAVFTILLAVCTVGVILKIVFERIRVLPVFACAAILTVIGFNAVNLDALVARYNINRYAETGKIDVNYLFNDLSLSAGNELLALAENEKDLIRQERFYNYIAGMCSDFGGDRRFGSWTFTEVMAYNRLMENPKIASKVATLKSAKNHNNWETIDKYHFDVYDNEDEAAFK